MCDNDKKSFYAWIYQKKKRKIHLLDKNKNLIHSSGNSDSKFGNILISEWLLSLLVSTKMSHQSAIVVEWVRNNIFSILTKQALLGLVPISCFWTLFFKIQLWILDHLFKFKYYDIKVIFRKHFYNLIKLHAVVFDCCCTPEWAIKMDIWIDGFQ